MFLDINRREVHTLGYKKLSNEQEKRLIQEYREGCAVNVLMSKYGFKTKKSITDKIKKHYPEEYKQIIEEAKNNRKGYCYKLEKITNEFDAYFLGLMLTDGYVTPGNKDKARYQVGIDLTDEDCIAFLSKIIGKEYHTYSQAKEAIMPDGRKVINRKLRHRLILEDKELMNNLIRFGVVPNKSKILKGPELLPEEEKFIPYIVRGIIDGDGTVSPTSYGAPQFRIVTASYDFAEWLVDILENRMYMIDIHKALDRENIYRIETADIENIEKLIALSYNKPFGMIRKYEEIRKTFRDYNKNLFE